MVRSIGLMCGHVCLLYKENSERDDKKTLLFLSKSDLIVNHLQINRLFKEDDKVSIM